MRTRKRLLEKAKYKRIWYKITIPKSKRHKWGNRRFAEHKKWARVANKVLIEPCQGEFMQACRNQLLYGFSIMEVASDGRIRCIDNDDTLC